LALNGSTGQARRKTNLDAVRIDPYGRLPSFSSSAPEETLSVGQSLLDRHELAGRVSLNIKQRQPDTAPPRGNGMRAQLTQNQDLPAVRLVGH